MHEDYAEWTEEDWATEEGRATAAALLDAASSYAEPSPPEPDEVDDCSSCGPECLFYEDCVGRVPVNECRWFAEAALEEEGS